MINEESEEDELLDETPISYTGSAEEDGFFAAALEEQFLDEEDESED